jgi:hypothetical protein
MSNDSLASGLSGMSGLSGLSGKDEIFTKEKLANGKLRKDFEVSNAVNEEDENEPAPIVNPND